MITRKKAADGNTYLIRNFIEVTKRGKEMRQMFDNEIRDGKKSIKVIDDIAKLATQCLSLEDKLRPEMVEVADRLRKCRKDLLLGRKGTIGEPSGNNCLPEKPTAHIPIDPSIKIQPSTIMNISLDELRELTRNFSDGTLIGEGTHAKVFLGELKDGRKSAVKKLGQNPVVKNLDGFFSEPDDKFVLQVRAVSRLKHDNVVQLLGYCVDGNVRAIIYEYSSRGSLRDILLGDKQ
nr:unnamed protein product [Digitaria exilis]